MHLHRLVKKFLMVLCCAALCFSGFACADDVTALWPSESQGVMEADLCVTPTLAEGTRPTGLTWEAAWWDEQCILLLASLQDAQIKSLTITRENGGPLGKASQVVVEPERLMVGCYSSAFDPPSEKNKGTFRLRLTVMLENDPQPHTWTENLALPESAWFSTRFLNQEAVATIQTPDAAIAGIRITPGRCTVLWQKKTEAPVTIHLSDAEGRTYPEVETSTGTYCETIFTSPYFAKTPLTLSIQRDSAIQTFEIPDSKN